MAESLYVIDTFSLLFQVFHAIRQPMTGAQGQPTNAVYGFTRDLQRIVEVIQPTHVICAWDSEGSGTRNDIYSEYKANRDEMPPDLRQQLPYVKEIVSAFGVPSISVENWEADDVIATLSRRAVERGMEVRLVSSDKDLRQLLGPQVQMYNMRKDTFLGEAELMDDWGIRPDQVIDFQSLVGDSVDNVPGVPLVGPKKASALLNEFGTLEDVLANADKAPGKKLKENLQTFADQARMSKELVTLNQHLEIEFDFETATRSEPDRERLLKLYEDLAFRGFAKQIREQLQGTAPSKKRTWEVVDTPAKFDKFLTRLTQQKQFCVDLETTSLEATQAEIVGWAIAWTAGEAYYIPVQGPPGDPCLAPDAVLDALKPLLEDPEIEIVNQNIKYDMIVLRRVGVELQGLGVDPMVGHYLLEAGARSHGLDALASHYLHHQMIPISELIGKGKQQKLMFEVEVDRAAEYASEDADIAWQLARKIGEELKEEKLWDLYWDLERPLIPVLVDLEFQGIKVDIAELERQSDDASARLSELEREIHELAGHEFNIDSPKQLRVVLFDELNLPVIKKTKTGPSTDQEVLEQLAPLHELPAKITEHRHLSKLRGTYLDALPEVVHPETGHIHASFNQVVAATGRLSSSDPNLQNIPIRTEEGRRVRKAFVPSEPGWKLVCADYSQIELRMLAHFSNDPALHAAFESGVDIHSSVASQIFQVETKSVTAEMRRIAKAVNFGVIYGQSAFGLSSVLKIEKEVAAEFIANYFEKYQGVTQFIDQVMEDTRLSGNATTILQRRRKITGIREQRNNQMTQPERTAINTVIQGSAADLIKRAMINVHQRLLKEAHAARMLLQIHDELVFEVPEAEVKSLISLVRHEMENAMQLNVPLVVDIKVGDNWLEGEPVEHR